AGWAHCKNTGNQSGQDRFPAFSNTSNPMGIPEAQGIQEFFRANYQRFLPSGPGSDKELRMSQRYSHLKAIDLVDRLG
ncbi:hypothetical protein VQ042_24880, partial [Aurantimonas sp. A2-1-M11]